MKNKKKIIILLLYDLLAIVYFVWAYFSLARSSFGGIGSPEHDCGWALWAGRPGPFFVCSFFRHLARRFWNQTCLQRKEYEKKKWEKKKNRNIFTIWYNLLLLKYRNCAHLCMCVYCMYKLLP